MRTGDDVRSLLGDSTALYFEGESLAADVRVHPNGRLVFVTNRGHDSIAVFGVPEAGHRLEALGHVDSGGRTPRHTALHPSGRALLVANQERTGAANSPLDDLERTERIELVRKALERLSERDRQMLLMREEGFRYTEIAEAVGVRSTSVGALVARALKKFSAAYEAVGETNASPE